MRLAGGHLAVVTTLRPSDQPCGDGPGFGTAGTGQTPSHLSPCHCGVRRAYLPSWRFVRGCYARLGGGWCVVGEVEKMGSGEHR